MAKKKATRKGPPRDPSNEGRETDPERDAIRAQDLNTTDPTTPFEALTRLNADLRQSSRLMGSQEARFLIDLYYQLQGNRIRMGNQVQSGPEEPSELLKWLDKNQNRFEDDLKRALHEFADAYKVGRWLMSLHGIAGVLSSNILAIFDIRQAETVGHWWRFSGLDPTRKWHGPTKAASFLSAAGLTSRSREIARAQSENLAELSGFSIQEIEAAWTGGIRDKKRYEAVKELFSRRPWNARAKTLVTFKVGECLIKGKGSSKDYYGRLYEDRKAYEHDLNDRGRYAEFAALQLQEKKYGDNEARKSYEAGRLPKGHIHARCRRWMSKLFLSHVHHVMYVDFYKKDPPVPYVFEMPGDHRHFIPIPNFPFNGEGKSLEELYARDEQYRVEAAKHQAKLEAEKKAKAEAKAAKKKSDDASLSEIEDLEADQEFIDPSDDE